MVSPTHRVCKILALWLLICSQLFAQRTQHVVIVVLDGVRYTESFGDSTHSNVPLLWNQLRPQGTLYTSFWNDGLTMTNSGHASILSGRRDTLKNNGTERPHNPTLFEYYRKQTGAPISQCWVVLGKMKLQMLSFSTHNEYGSPFGASVRTSPHEYDDLIALKNATSVLSEYHPAITIVNVPAPDEFAHNGFYEEYIGAIQQADSVATAVWEAIQSDSLLRDKTTLIVTNDHGRHTRDYTDHGDTCEGCRHIMLLIIGPDTPAGVTDSSTHKQVDIAPTVGKLLGFKTPNAVGEVIESAVSPGVQNPRR
jgi:Metalloenzyme superfamily